MIRFKEHMNQIKGFPNDYWYDSRVNRQGNESNHWSPDEDWIKSKNIDTDQPQQTQGQGAQMNRIKDF